MELNRMIGVGATLFGLVLLLIVIPNQTREASFAGGLAPSTFPNVMSVIIVLAGIVQFVKPTGTANVHVGELGWASIVVAIAATGLWVMSTFGYLYAAPIIILTLMLFGGERRPAVLVVGSLLCPLVIWFVFVQLLGRVLP